MKTGARITAAAALAGLLAASAALAPAAAQQQESSSEDAEERTIEVRAVRPAGPRAPERGWLGATVENLDAGEAREAGLDAPRGARVLEVREGTPAADAGLREGDVLLRLDGREVRSAAHLTRLVEETPPGREVALQVRRDGETRSLTATVGERPGPHVLRLRRGPWDMERQMEALEEVEGLSEEARERMRQKMMQLRERMEQAHEHAERAREHGEAEHEHMERMKRMAPRMRTTRRMMHAGGPPRLGIEMQKLTDQLAEHFGVGERGGVLVASVREGSAAAEAGLRAGDVVVAFDGEPVTDAGELFEAVHGAEAGPVPLGVVRDGEERTVEVDLPERREARSGLKPSRAVSPPRPHAGPPAGPGRATPAPPAPARPGGPRRSATG